MISLQEVDQIDISNTARIKAAFEKDNVTDNVISTEIKKTCAVANTLYIFFHLAYVVFFFIMGKNLMGYINVTSVIFYCLLTILLRTNKHNIYVVLCGIEIGAYMTASTFIVGWQAGFHICLLGLCLLVFFTSYFSKKASNVIRPIPWCLAILADYIFLFFWCKYNRPYYDLDTTLDTMLFIAHLIVVFFFTGYIMVFFTNYVLRLEKKIIRDSKTDELTQIGNRKALEAYFSSLDMENEKYCLTIFDIDDFKKINDKYGHLCGDYILRELAYTALMTKQRTSFVIRFGGEEFLIISKITHSYEDTCKLSEDFRSRMENKVFYYDGNNINLTITLGTAIYENNLSIDDWVKIADSKLYSGKLMGKNQLVK